MIPKEFSVTITQEHIDKAVASVSNHVGVCRSCIVWQAVSEEFPNQECLVGYTGVNIEPAYYAADEETMPRMIRYTNMNFIQWNTAIPGKTIRFVLSEE